MTASLITDLMSACRGRWDVIFSEVGGIPASVVSRRRHQPCPACGGTDRFRFTKRNAEDGGWWCNQCGGPNRSGGPGDGLDLLERVQKWSRQEAIAAVRRWLGDPSSWRNSPEAEAARQRWEEKQKRLAREREAAKVEAYRRFTAAVPTTEADPDLVARSYWGKKGLTRSDRVRIEPDGTILVPMARIHSGVTGVHTIAPDGQKRDHGQKEGTVFYFGEADSSAPVVAVAEGVADAASIYEATGWPTFCGFGTGGLDFALTWAKSLFVVDGVPGGEIPRRLMLCADNDEPGLLAARQLRRRHDFVLAVPPDGAGKDFDDFRRSCGLEVVRAWLESAHERDQPTDDDETMERTTGTDDENNLIGAWDGPEAAREESASAAPQAAEAPQKPDEGDRPDPFAGMDDEQKQLWQALQALGGEEDLAKRRYRLAKLAAAHRMPISLLMQIADSLLDPEAAAAEQRRVFEVWDEDDLFAPCDDDALLLHYVIPGIAPVGEALLLAGEAKAGKSLLMYEAIAAVLNGGQFLGEQCRRGKVLLLQLEENNSLKLRLTAKGINSPENKGRFRVIRNFDATSPKALDQLRRELHVFKPDLVCLDSLRGAMTNSEESENNQGWCRPIKKVIRVCQEENAALIAIHHTNKNREAEGNDRVSGSKALIGEFWGIARIERNSTSEDDPFRTLAVTPRDAASYRLKLQFCPPADGEAFAWRHSGILAGDATSQDLRNRLLALLQTTGELRTGAVCERFPDEQPETVRRCLYRLRDLGLVVSRKGQTDGGGRPPTLWRLNSDHFSGLKLTTPVDGGERTIFAQPEGGDTHTPAVSGVPMSQNPSQDEGGDTHTPTLSRVAMSQNPPSETDVLGHVTKPAQNPEPPEGPSLKEKMSFVTLGHVKEQGCVCVPQDETDPTPSLAAEQPSSVVSVSAVGTPEPGDPFKTSERPLMPAEVPDFVVGSEWTDVARRQLKDGTELFLRVDVADEREGVILSVRRADKPGTPQATGYKLTTLTRLGLTRRQGEAIA